MPIETGNKQQLGQVWTDAPFVKRVEMALMQYVILGKAKQGEVTRENLQSTFRGNLQMSADHFDHCIKQLVADGHLKEEGNKYNITDDGREDVQKLTTLIQEVPNVVNGGAGQQQRQGIPQQQSAGGRTTGTTTGQQPGAGTSSNQGTNVDQANQGVRRDTGAKGGATSPGTQR